MSKIIYYIADENDVEILVENRILFALELAGKQSEESILILKKQMTKYFSTAIVDKSCVSVIAKCDGIVAGIESVHIREMPGSFKNPSGKWGYILSMYTVKEHRKKGICGNILNKLVEKGTQMGVAVFELHANKEGEPVYIKNGFLLNNQPNFRKFI